MSSGFSGLQNNIGRNLLCGPGSSGDGWRGGSHPSLVSFKRPSQSTFFLCKKPQNHSLSVLRSLVASSFGQTHANLPSDSAQALDNLPRKELKGFSLCNNQQRQGEQRHSPLNSLSPFLGSPGWCFSTGSHVERAWAHWNKVGKPKLIIAPMFDNSELPFRLLCRRYGAEAGYTPMLNARIFSESEKYRSEEFTTCKEDRPLFVQFCANDPDILFEAARRVEPYCDYVDINLGCPQNIARRGNYGAFLMDNLPLVKALVQKLALNLNVPVSCKIRVFPNLQDTINYAKMLEEAGCSLLAVHGRTRDEKDGKKFRADWDAIKAVKAALKIPVLGNGNIRHMGDVLGCLEETNVDGVLSAESLLENPALFAGFCTAEWVEGSKEKYKDGNLDQADLIIEYLKLCEEYPVPWRMIQSHVYKILGEWFKIHPHIREDLNKQSELTFEFLYDMVNRLKVMDGRIPLYVKDDQVRRTSATW